jgi:prolipoprotein diacylglyceryltransferase
LRGWHSSAHSSRHPLRLYEHFTRVVHIWCIWIFPTVTKLRLKSPFAISPVIIVFIISSEPLAVYSLNVLCHTNSCSMLSE